MDAALAFLRCRHIKNTSVFMALHLISSQSGTDYTVSQKSCAKLFLSELCQMSTNFDNFWQEDGKEAKIMQGVPMSVNPFPVAI